jgi:hypothetical protein
MFTLIVLIGSLLFIFTLVYSSDINNSLKWILPTLVAILVLSSVFLLTIPGYSKGAVVGTIEKVSTKGIFFKTHEITIILSSGDVMTRELKQLSTSSLEIKDSLYQHVNDKVKLEYNENYLTSVRDGKTNYDVYNFEIIKIK